MEKLKIWWNETINNERKLIYVLGSVLFVLTSITAIAILLFIQNLNKEEIKPIFTDDDKKVIASIIKVSDAKSGDYTYQSPTYDFQITIDLEKYRYEENNNGISIIGGSYDSVGSLYVSENTESYSFSEYRDRFEKNLKFYDNYTFVKKEEKEIDGQKALIIEYTFTNYTDNVMNANAAFIINEDYIYEFSQKQFDIDTPELTIIEDLFNTFKFIDSDKLVTKAEFESSLWGYKFEYDNKYWTLTTNSSGADLRQREYQRSPEDTIEVTLNSNEVSRRDLMGRESTYLEDFVDKEIADMATNQYHKYTDVTSTKVKLDGRTAYKVQYMIEDELSYSPKYYTIYYTLHYNTITKIVFNYGDEKLLVNAQLLIDTFTILEPSSGSVKGVTSDSDLVEKNALLAKPAVMKVIYEKCFEANIPYDAEYPNVTGKKYSACAAGYGTGFFISSDGYLATNGHVVYYEDNELLESVGNMELIINIFKDIYIPKLEEVYPGEYINMTDKEILQFIQSDKALLYEIVDFQNQVFIKTYDKKNTKENYWVQKNINAIQTDYISFGIKNTDDYYKAELIDFDYDSESTIEEELSSDVAILKIEDGDYPVMKLGNIQDVIEGTEIMAIGFPAMADFDTDIEDKETYTKGVVSRIVTSSENRKIIQFDATISGGNSGGPLVHLKEGKVIGLNTYGNTGGFDYHYARDIQDLKNLLEKNDIKLKSGDTQKYYEEGISYFYEGKFSKSIDSLEKALDIYGELEGVEKIISLAEQKVADGLDYVEPENKDLLTYIDEMDITTKILYGSVLALLLIVFLMSLGIIIVFGKLRKISKANSKTNVITEQKHNANQNVQATNYVNSNSMPTQQQVYAQPMPNPSQTVQNQYIRPEA